MLGQVIKRLITCFTKRGVINMFQRIFFGMIAVAAVAGAQTFPRRAAIVGGGSPDRGQCTVEVVVDGAAEVEIRGDTAVLRNLFPDNSRSGAASNAVRRCLSILAISVFPESTGVGSRILFAIRVTGEQRWFASKTPTMDPSPTRLI